MTDTETIYLVASHTNHMGHQDHVACYRDRESAQDLADALQAEHDANRRWAFTRGGGPAPFATMHDAWNISPWDAETYGVIEVDLVTRQEA